MMRVLGSAALLVGLAALGVRLAAPARAQETEEVDVVKKKDKTQQQGKITKEDLKSIQITPAGTKASIGIDWGVIVSIEYGGVGAPAFRQAKQAMDGGSIQEAIGLFEDLRKKDIRAILKPHVLSYLGACYLRYGDPDKSIAAYEELFKAYPQTHDLVTGGGANLVDAYLAKGNPQGAAATLDRLMQAAGADPSLNLLRARVQEASGDFAGAAGSYKSVMDGASDEATKGAAELGIARCLFGQKKTAEAEAKFRGLVSRDLPWLVLAGAWNGIGEIMYQSAADKKDKELMTDALFSFLRGCVLYVPQSGESTETLEHALFGSYKCFKAMSELADDKEKKPLAGRAKERLELLQTKFPNSPYLRGK